MLVSHSPPKSRRARLVGLPLAGETVSSSYKLVFAQMRGGNDFLAFLMSWNSFRHSGSKSIACVSALVYPQPSKESQ
eukprot:6294732-Alexandrium_andersonii.AAC.1